MFEPSDGPVVFVGLVRHDYTGEWPTVKIAMSQAALERKIAEVLLGEARLLEAAEEWEDENAQLFVEQVRRGDQLWDAITAYCETTDWETNVDWIGLYLPAVEVTEDLDQILS